ncbi:MAG TPA: hypothetical protein VEV83_00890 [Parafilimonas sp.]|nr:hypothetical protein [Parafilimonas sp.]
MRNHIFVHVNGKTYMQRLKPTLVGPLLFVFFVISIGYLGTESVWTILAGLLLLGFYLIEKLRWGRIYITDIRELPDEKLKITYLDKDEVKEYVGEKKSLHLQRNAVWYTTHADKEQYIVIKDEQKGFSLKQYALGDWENEMIDKLVKDWEPQGSLV